MAKDKIQLAEIADLISTQLNINPKAADDFLKALVSVIEESLMKNEQVKIKGLGTFKLIWNEPRKSVDVNTGADIIIDGYYKAGFTPEAGLKEMVNEPYAHLQAVSLDDKATQPVSQVKKVEEKVAVEESGNSSQLKMLHEQANEIKGILSEINALRKTETKTEMPVEDEVVVQAEVKSPELPESPEIKPEVKPEIIREDKPEVKTELEPDVVPPVVQESRSEVKAVAEEPQNTAEEKQERNYKPREEEAPAKFKTFQAPNFDQAKIDRQVKKPGKRIDVIFVLLMVGAAVVYMLSDMDIFSEFSKLLKSSEPKVEDVREPVYQETIVPDSTAMLEDTLSQDDVVAEEEPVDSMEVIFNKPRVYKEFIATEEVRVGSRLTRISERYYGEKDFWVYIYEANKEKFVSPDDVEPGTMLRIPKMDPRLVDPNNKRCLEYARKLHDLYVKK
jgi:nucleoid DNA-binding protein